jgi:hypothetical protein
VLKVLIGGRSPSVALRPAPPPPAGRQSLFRTSGTVCEGEPCLRDPATSRSPSVTGAEDRVEALYAALIDEVIEILTGSARRPWWRRWFR